ncbi:MAG: hypothetical protein ACODAE_03840 [Gemmatimonadota bacterium]
MRRAARRALAGTVLRPCLAVPACGDDDAGPDLPGEPASVTLPVETVHLAATGAIYPLTATVSDASGIALGNAAVS